MNANPMLDELYDIIRELDDLAQRTRIQQAHRHEPIVTPDETGELVSHPQADEPDDYFDGFSDGLNQAYIYAVARMAEYRAHHFPTMRFKANQ